MKKITLVPLVLLLTLASAVVARQGGIAHIGGFDLDFRKGNILLSGPTPSGKATVVLTGGEKPIVLTTQESAGAALKKAKLKSRRRELTGQKVVINVINYNVKDKKALVSGATLTKNVTIFLEEIALEGEKSSLKVRCDEAVFKAGAKLGTGRIDFSGDVHLWSYGGAALTDGELTAKAGYIDLGDPDDPENNPRRVFLGDGSMTGNPKLTEGKDK